MYTKGLTQLDRGRGELLSVFPLSQIEIMAVASIIQGGKFLAMKRL